MANNFTPVGSELQINLAPNQNLGQTDPEIAALTDGRFFVAFTDFDADANIIGQFVNANGTLSGSNINIDIGAGAQLRRSAVAARSGGGAIVVWDDDAVSQEIHYALVSSAGVVGAEQTILDSAGLDDPRVATLADGRSLVVATQFNFSADIVFRFVDPAGAPTGVQEFIDSGNLGQFEAAVAAFGNNALVVYREEDAAAGDGDIQARFFNGSSFAGEVTIANTGDLDDPDVAALIDGRFVVAWNDDVGDDLHFRFVSAAGVPLGAVFDVADLGAENDHPRVAALSDGGFILTWESDAGVIPPDLEASNAVLGRRFNSTGTPIGDIFLVNQGDNDSQDDPAVATNAAGKTFVVWEDSFDHTGTGEDAESDGIRGRAFVATTDLINGTTADDIVQTYNLGETINGLEGDDVINAFGGNDIVHGNSGFDRILGGLGNDQLFGDSGEDLLNGEDGDDLLVGGIGRDVQIGGLGADTFDFNKFNESRVGANHDLIKGFKRTENDKINLQTIDADTTAGGNQAFDLIGNAAFSGTAGELRFAAGLLQGDTNGDGIANFEVKVTGLGVAANGDFVL